MEITILTIPEGQKIILTLGPQESSAEVLGKLGIPAGKWPEKSEREALPEVPNWPRTPKA